MLINRILTRIRLAHNRLGVRFLAALPAYLMIGTLSGPCTAVYETVDLPLTIDYPLLRSLVAATVFTNPNETATVLDEKSGCRRITLSGPKYRSEGSHLQFEVKAAARLGSCKSMNAFGGECMI